MANLIVYKKHVIHRKGQFEIHEQSYPKRKYTQSAPIHID